MSHHPNMISPEGTPFTGRTVGELVAERPGRSRVFQSFGIDFCCQGGRKLAEACERKGVSVDGVIEHLEAELAEKPSFHAAGLPAHELAEYIVETHHGYLRREFPRLRAMSERVAHVHGGHTPALQKVFQVYCGLEAELNSHMEKEEQILFPAVSAMSRGEAAPVSLDGPITCMVHEHERAGNALKQLHELTNGYQPPEDACNTYRALFAGLADLEEDLHRHIHLENSVLFPAAEALAGFAENHPVSRR
jgi:regulator of cell morphogenesis and NO signaling